MADVEGAHHRLYRRSNQALIWGLIGSVVICLSAFGPSKPHAQEAGGAGAREQRCVATIEAHGFLSRAQFQCGIKDYSEAMFLAAKDCIASLSSQRVNNLLRKGMVTFDDREKRSGGERHG